MLSLGLSGGLDPCCERREYLFPPGTAHDAAAALAEDGVIVAAAEEERFNRVKHSAKAPAGALRHVLGDRGVRIGDIDRIVYYGTEEGLNLWTRDLFYGSSLAAPITTFRRLLHEFFEFALGEPVADERLAFVHHHLAHAIAAYVHSGFPESLVVTLDGGGDGISGSVSRWTGDEYRVVATVPAACSLGNFYDRVIQMLGYGFTEEFKVMGLAPYGNPVRAGATMRELYRLLPDGAFAIDWGGLPRLYDLAPVRKRDDPILQEHMDVAAALQAAVEDMAVHLIGHFARTTGLSRLCLSGGVAHNSTLNGRLLYSGQFSDIFVHPASADSGCAMGAALAPFLGQQPASPGVQRQRLSHVFLGSGVGDEAGIAATLERWSAFLDTSRLGEVATETAGFLAAGEVIGWVQGRAEFGPRALGHRSILADPRPAANKDVVNAMVKKREAFRPFAPAVAEEALDTYFDLPRSGMSLPFMSFTVKVRPEHRPGLAAITHVDGTARVQTVCRDDDPAFHALLVAFGRMTGAPILLNTSFNNNAEPIVDDIDDAVACFLTTGLDRLVIPPFSCRRRDRDEDAVFGLAAILPAYARLGETTAHTRRNGATTAWSIGNTFDERTQPLGETAYRLLREARPDRPMADLDALRGADRRALADELWHLWSVRAIALRPPDVAR